MVNIIAQMLHENNYHYFIQIDELKTYPKRGASLTCDQLLSDILELINVTNKL
jgi:hypothetical protein